MSFQATVYGIELMPMGKIVYYADNEIGRAHV